jgi:hypothetical protein
MHENFVDNFKRSIGKDAGILLRRYKEKACHDLFGGTGMRRGAEENI